MTAKTNPKGGDATEITKTFRPTFSKRVSMLFWVLLIAPFAAGGLYIYFYKLVIGGSLLGDSEPWGVGKFVMATVPLASFCGGVIFFAWRQSIVSVTIYPTRILYKSLFKEVSISNSEIVGPHLRKVIGIGSTAGLRIRYPGGSLILLSYEFTVGQLNEMFGLIKQNLDTITVPVHSIELPL